jgi:hypothetical protein
MDEVVAPRRNKARLSNRNVAAHTEKQSFQKLARKQSLEIQLTPRNYAFRSTPRPASTGAAAAAR